jgi:hypothetical protein
LLNNLNINLFCLYVLIAWMTYVCILFGYKDTVYRGSQLIIYTRKH